jgi:hypothetical protein
MPLRATNEMPQDEMTQYEGALVKSLSERYEVYSGQRVLEKVLEVYRKRSTGTKAGSECDETKCIQDVAIEFQAQFVAVANIRKTGDGYSIALTINDVVEDKSVFSESLPCEGCNEFEVLHQIKAITGKLPGLRWQTSPYGGWGRLKKWEEALEYCESLSLDGHSDWRLPSKEEPLSLVPNHEMEISSYPIFWSSTIGNVDDYYIAINFRKSKTWGGPTEEGYFWNSNKEYASSVRCVRGHQ